MFAALAASLVFTFTYATLAAKSRRWEMVLIPLLDILQSVPILGFLSFTVTFFLGLFPGNTLGAELAAIFAIFTSQAWNMAFSFYQSLRTVPRDLDEVARGFRLTGWQKFWQLEAPFAMPGLIWNTMMSMSGGWFFVVASEAITVGDTTITLPGVGSYIAKANDEGNWSAIGAAVLTMAVVILLYDQLLFRPIVAWADKFRVELSASQEVASLLGAEPSAAHPLGAHGRPGRFSRRCAASSLLPLRLPRIIPRPARRRAGQPACHAFSTRFWILVVVAVAAWAAWLTIPYIATEVRWDEVGHVFVLTFYTLVRVVVLMALARLVWVPISVWIGLRPRWAEAVQPFAQFLAAFPVNLLFGAAVSLILAFNLNPEHLAQLPDRVRHAMVYRVQHDRRRGGLPQRPARGGGQFPRSRLGLVAAGDPARHRALLPDRRHHRVGRLVERLDRRRICQVEGPYGRRAWRRRLYRRGDRRRATSRKSCSASR